MRKPDRRTRMREHAHVTKKDLLKTLHELGLHRGGMIIAHSSLSSFGYVEPTGKPTDAAIVEAISGNASEDKTAKDRTTSKVQGANTVIEALLECVGPEGVVMMPSFNHGGAKLYDPARTPTTNGVIADVFWRLPGARRSLHPTHPYAAAGRDAGQLLEGNMQASTFGKDSPLGKLIADGGYILLLGVGLGSSTAMHVAESIAGVPCLGYREDLGKLLKDARVTYVPIDVWREAGECYVERAALEHHMREAAMIRDTTVGEAQVHLLKGADLVNTVVHLAEEYCLKQCPIRPDYKRAAAKLREEILSLQQEGRIPY